MDKCGLKMEDCAPTEDILLYFPKMEASLGLIMIQQYSIHSRQLLHQGNSNREGEVEELIVSENDRTIDQYSIHLRQFLRRGDLRWIGEVEASLGDVTANASTPESEVMADETEDCEPTVDTHLYSPKIEASLGG